MPMETRLPIVRKVKYSPIGLRNFKMGDRAGTVIPEKRQRRHTRMALKVLWDGRKTPEVINSKFLDYLVLIFCLCFSASAQELTVTNFVTQRIVMVTTNTIPPSVVPADGSPPSPRPLPESNGMWVSCPTCGSHALQFREFVWRHTNNVTTTYHADNFAVVAIPPYTNWVGSSLISSNVVIRARPPLSIERTTNPRAQ